MGTWGPGNFENDWCADQLASICEPWLAHIHKAMDAVDLLEDEIPDETVPAYLEIIACLSENLGRYKSGGLYDWLYPSVLPAPDIVADWKQKYIAKWDQHIDLYAPAPEHKKERRAVIVQTFDRVLRLSLSRCEQGTYPDIRSTIRYLMADDDSES
jgi:hypothetical protein